MIIIHLKASINLPFCIKSHARHCELKNDFDLSEVIQYYF